jgi:spoIIIJ-associated protein
MKKEEIQNLIRELVERTKTKLENVTISEDDGDQICFSVEINEPHSFLGRDGEALYALNHLVRRIVDNQTSKEDKEDKTSEAESTNRLANRILVDINGFQKKRIESIRAVAHMMSERARYFKSNIEVDPMSAFERRIVHEFLSDASDLETESIGSGTSRRVVIKYTG